jgi:hypothetical protein
VIADASGLVALLDRNEPDHDPCLAVVAGHGGPLRTTWPALTEAMYLLHRSAGWPGTEALWQMTARGHLLLANQATAAAQRMRDLMRTYRDPPMALADASLVALAEERREARILSLDKHFHAYVATWSRRGHGFDVLPPA